jgi:hypothetical protein
MDYYPHNARAIYHDAVVAYLAAPRRSAESRAALEQLEISRANFLRALGEP